MSESPPQPFQNRSASENSNVTQRTPSRTLRLVSPEPPRLLGQASQQPYGNEVFGRTPLPTHPSHILSPSKGKGKDVSSALHLGFQPPRNTHHSTSSIGSTGSSTHTTPQPGHNVNSATGSPISSPKPRRKKVLQLHKDNKTFSLVHQDEAQFPDDLPQSPLSPTLSSKSSTDFLFQVRSNASNTANTITSCEPATTSTGSADPFTTPEPESKPALPANPTPASPSRVNKIVGGLRIVPITPDSKHKLAVTSKSEGPLPNLERTSDASTQPSHDLSTKQSFQSNVTSTTTSENTNYKVYRDISATTSEAADLDRPSSNDSNYQLLGDPSPPISAEPSVIYRPRTGISGSISESDNENYEIYGEPSPTPSYVNLLQPDIPQKYSHESLVVPPLQGKSTRKERSNENLGYYKQRSRESLRTNSFTSINTILTQPEVSGVGGNVGVKLPPLPPKQKGTGSWTDPINVFSLRSPMNETPHQWSSQLSTVHSVSDLGSVSNRGSVQSWSDDGRQSSGFPSSPSRHSRQMLSISSSMALPSEDGTLSPLEPPRPAYARGAQRQMSYSSNPIAEDHEDEYGDVITDMQDVRLRPQRSRTLSGFFSVASSDNGNDGRTNTMRSTSSSRTGSLLASSIPAWARLYYGSGERRGLQHLSTGAPSISTDASLDSRNNSFRSGSPNTDHFPLSIYSPRRRPREGQQLHLGDRNSLEISPAPHLGSDGNLINDPFGKKFRTWSMSSMWSPHLRLDRRATKASMWEPPSVNWSSESGGWFGRRNVQIVMFIVGFIFPFGKSSCHRV